MESETIIHQKLKALFNKHDANGTTPRKLLEANISRELRFTKSECHNLINQFNLERKEAAARKAVQASRVKVHPEYAGVSPHGD